jgi:hypothetical protein
VEVVLSGQIVQLLLRVLRVVSMPTAVIVYVLMILWAELVYTTVVSNESFLLKNLH